MLFNNLGHLGIVYGLHEGVKTYFGNEFWGHSSLLLVYPSFVEGVVSEGGPFVFAVIPNKVVHLVIVSLLVVTKV